MKVLRKYRDLEVTIELTKDDLYRAHREYIIQEQIINEVKDFILEVLGFDNSQEDDFDVLPEFDYDEAGISEKDLLKMASLVYDERLNDIGDTYALAKAVIPYLESINVLTKDISPDKWIEE